MPQKIKVCFLGGPCTGKTSLMARLYEVLAKQGVEVSIAEEFATIDIARNGAPSLNNMPFEQIRYYFNQQLIEQNALSRSNVVLTDSPPFMCYFYALFAQRHTAENPRHKVPMADLKKAFFQDAPRYHHLYLLDREFPYEDNGIRYHSEEQAREVDGIINELVTNHPELEYKRLSGTIDERAQKVLADLFSGRVAKAS